MMPTPGTRAVPWRCAGPVVCILSLLPMAVPAVETVQWGFILHDEGKAKLSLSGIRSGELCAEIDGTDNVCSIGASITVQGRDSCTGTAANEYPCTRYGYRYDYSGATPGTKIECTATRHDGYNRRQKSYSVPVDTESGSVFQPQWIPYNRVDKRLLLSEVHECTYLGEPLATIEYIIRYEPTAGSGPVVAGGPHPDLDEPYATGVPDACNYLTKGLGSLWLKDEVYRYESVIEHMPILRSHCAYTAANDAGSIARIEHKFHVHDLFDVEQLSPDQLLFHAAFAGGGHQPEAVLTDLGKITFVYQLADENRSAISVVTGIQGPRDGAGRAMTMLAHYHLRTPERSHEERLKCLFDLARKSLGLWLSQVSETDNTVTLPDNPDIGATCPR